MLATKSTKSSNCQKTLSKFRRFNFSFFVTWFRRFWSRPTGRFLDDNFFGILLLLDVDRRLNDLILGVWSSGGCVDAQNNFARLVVIVALFDVVFNVFLALVVQISFYVLDLMMNYFAFVLFFLLLMMMLFLLLLMKLFTV